MAQIQLTKLKKYYKEILVYVILISVPLQFIYLLCFGFNIKSMHSSLSTNINSTWNVHTNVSNSSTSSFPSLSLYKNWTDIVHTNVSNSSFSVYKKKKKRKSNSFPFLVFQVGFHKCGTRSLYKFFRHNSVPSVHNNRFNDHPYPTTLSNIMNEFYANNQLAVSNLSDTYMFYSDYGTVTTKDQTPWYEILTKQYPKSKFILGIRNVNHWLRSRYTHFSIPHRGFISDNIKKHTVWPKDLADIEKDVSILSEWHVEWYKYICNLLTYFEENHLKNRLVIWDVEYDRVDKLTQFFNMHNFPLKSWTGHVGSTQQKKQATVVTIQLEKWKNITIRYPKFNHSVIDDEFNNEYDRIRENCNKLSSK